MLFITLLKYFNNILFITKMDLDSSWWSNYRSRCFMMFNFIISIFNNIITYIFIQPSPIYKRFKICRNGEYELTMGVRSKMKVDEDDVLG